MRLFRAFSREVSSNVTLLLLKSFYVCMYFHRISVAYGNLCEASGSCSLRSQNRFFFFSVGHHPQWVSISIMFHQILSIVFNLVYSWFRIRKGLCSIWSIHVNHVRHETVLVVYRTIGFAMVAFGFLMVFTAFIKSCKNITNGNRSNVSSIFKVPFQFYKSSINSNFTT